MEAPIYLDNNSTTQMDPDVLAAMLPFFCSQFGNPSNTLHSYGASAADAVEKSRSQVAIAIGASPKDIVFTSGATESNNLAILGVCRANSQTYDHIVTTAVEHKSVLEACRQAALEGYRVTYLPVDRFGRVAPKDVDQALTPTTLLVSVMAANNEVGTVQPLREIGAICQDRRVLLHSDAVQCLGRIPIDVDCLNVDLLSISAHKVYGPKGAGALYVRNAGGQFGLTPLLFGGGQENGIRAGTHPVPQIVGFGAACEKACPSIEKEARRIDALRDKLERRLRGLIPTAVIHGDPEHRLPGLLNIGFPDVVGDVLVHLLGGVAFSQGSSCSSGTFEPSHVLLAMRIDADLARASIRLGVGRFTTEQEVEAAAQIIAAAVTAATEAETQSQHFIARN